MTADIKLLPLPEWCQGCGESLPRDMQDYARACVAHATAAKDAEIDALRAEVRLAYAAADSKAGWEWKKRADRLAEALQWYAEQAEGCRKIGSIGEPFRKELDRDGGKRARAALRDHDQEGKDG